MKRFHVHVAVSDLDKSIHFYSRLFGCQPSVLQHDYAKWMLEDPRLNFAISQRGVAAGINHLGFQLDSGEALQAMRGQLLAADADISEQNSQACCYAKSDKYWVTDPAGIAWETFHTLESIPVFGEPAAAESADPVCCVPLAPAIKQTGAACCVPNASASGSACCAA
jgi:catechol 2,3-dioxygenase-like lactoylglutathione lyase family enzyme